MCSINISIMWNASLLDLMDTHKDAAHFQPPLGSSRRFVLENLLDLEHIAYCTLLRVAA